MDSSDKEFINDEIIKIIEDAIYFVFGAKQGETQAAINIWQFLLISNEKIRYSKEKVNSWCNQIIENTIRNLSKLQKQFKYVVTCIIQQNTGAPMYNCACGFYDVSYDGMVSTQVEVNDIIVLCNVFGLLI